MGAAPLGGRRPGLAILKVAYLAAVTAAVFAVPAVAATRPAQWFVVPGLLALQVIVLLVCGVSLWDILRPVGRLKWLFVFLLLCYTLLPPDGPDVAGDAFRWPTGAAWAVTLYPGGSAVACRMCLQIVTVILASAAVRRSAPGSGLIDGLSALGAPALFVYAFDLTLAMLGDQPAPGQRRGGRGTEPESKEGGRWTRFLASLGRLLRGDVRPLVQSVNGGLEKARGQVTASSASRLDPGLANDVAIVTGIAFVMLSLKVVKLLPGIPFAPGIKAVALFPLYALAARLTRSRWGATATGGILGLVSFLQGDGRYGALDVFQHLAPGLVFDLANPLTRRLRPSALVYCVLGLAAAVLRTSTELLVVFLVGARAEIYLFPAAKLVPNLIAGTLSGFVSAFVLRAFASTVVPDASQGQDKTGRVEVCPGAAAPIETPPPLPLDTAGGAESK